MIAEQQRITVAVETVAAGARKGPYMLPSSLSDGKVFHPDTKGDTPTPDDVGGGAEPMANGLHRLPPDGVGEIAKHDETVAAAGSEMTDRHEVEPTVAVEYHAQPRGRFPGLFGFLDRRSAQLFENHTEP